MAATPETAIVLVVGPQPGGFPLAPLDLRQLARPSEGFGKRTAASDLRNAGCQRRPDRVRGPDTVRRYGNHGWPTRSGQLTNGPDCLRRSFDRPRGSQPFLAKFQRVEVAAPTLSAAIEQPARDVAQREVEKAGYEIVLGMELKVLGGLYRVVVQNRTMARSDIGELASLLCVTGSTERRRRQTRFPRQGLA